MTPLTQHVQIRTRCPHITLHSFLVPHLWLKVNLTVCPILSFHFIPLARLSLAPHRTPSTSSSTFSSVPGFQRWLTSRIPCADPREPRGDGYTDPEPRTGYEPHRIVDNQVKNRRILPALPKLRATSRLCPSTSHCCLLLKILLKVLLRLKKETWTKNKFMLCWLHHGTYRSEKQVRNDRKFITLKVGLNFKGTGRLVALFSHQRKFESRIVFQESNHLKFQGVMNRPFRNSNTANVAKSLLDGNRDHLLSQTRSELMKQEQKVESLNSCICELQQQAYAQRLELEDPSRIR